MARTILNRVWRRVASLGLLIVAGGVLLGAFSEEIRLRDRNQKAFQTWSASTMSTARKVDTEILARADMPSDSSSKPLAMAELADWQTVCRRLSLGLVGCTPSLEELRAIDKIGSGGTGSEEADWEKIQWWTDYLLSDPRWSEYFAERFSRAMLGTDQGPFVVFRRNRFDAWLASEFAKGTRYDRIVQDILVAEGLWTGSPEVNFLTASITREGGRQVDPVVLAGRTSRVFLGMRLDCLQCHDDLLGSTQLGTAESVRTGTQLDFHRLAAYFGSTGISKNPFAGLRDSFPAYKTQLLGETEPTKIEPGVPFQPEICAVDSRPRHQLATWVTHPSNEAFARATVNREWAILCGKPLVEPIDDIPLHGPRPPGLDSLAQHFVRTHYDLKEMVRTIVATEAFRRRSSLSNQEVTAEHEARWLVFPLSQLRPEQVAASLHQACRLQIIDQESSILAKLERFGTLIDFTKAYGDRGEDEFQSQPITIPQRLLVMNGKYVRERIDENPLLNAGAQIAFLAESDEQAVEAAYLSVLGRLPTDEEQKAFLSELEGARGSRRTQAIGDIFWILLNSTEFLWNH